MSHASTPTTPTPESPEDGSPRARARRAVAGLSRADRIRLVSGRDFWTTQELPGVPSFLLTDGPHGLRKQVGDTDHIGLAQSVPATCFPTGSALGSTWDVDLLERVGRALGAEARAQEVAVLLGPALNIVRHPAGGRTFEYLSEDPHLSGMLAAALVRGIQSEGVAACAKHFAANNQETNRMVADTIVDERTLRELYLRGFELVVEHGRPGAVMTAYNLVNGQYASDSEHLVRDVLRGEWRHDGLVVSDWVGTNDRVAGLAVGLDLEMPGGSAAFDGEVADALDSGRLRLEALDRCAERVAERALLAQARPEAPGQPDLDAHHVLARSAAVAATVLLTNDGLLPLAGTSLAVVGAFAAEPRYQGAGSSRVTPTRVDSLLDALRGYRAEVAYAPGYDPTTGATTPAQLAEAAAAARAADDVVLVVGLPGRSETEGMDRAHCRLGEDMGHLVEIVLDANPSTAVVLVNGGAVELPWAARPAALVAAHLGGQAGGSALAQVLLGLAEPGGRLSSSIPARVADLPADATFPGSGRQVQYREGLNVGYRFHETWGVPALFPFGHGLSYTTIELDPVEVTGEGTDLTVQVQVTNTGSRAGSEVVQVYVRGPQSAVARPDRELRGFAKVHLAPGESAQVRVPLDRRSFAIWDRARGDWAVEAGRYELLVGTSSTRIHAVVRVDVSSSDVVGPVPATAGPVASDAEFAALLGRPLPEPRPVRPFTRTSTLAELSTSRLGAVVAAGLRAGVARRIDPGELDGSADMLDAVVTGMPVRAFVQASGGALTFGVLDRVLALLNGDPWGVLRGRR